MRGRLAATALIALALSAALAAPPSARAGDRQRDAEKSPALQQANNLLRVASLLLKDGHLDRAAATLAEIDAATPGLDRARYHTLGGLVALHRKQSKLAAQHLTAALEAGQQDRNVYLLLAQARFGQQDFAGTLEAIARAGELGQQHPAVHAMRAQCHWRVGDHAGAWRALDEGIARHAADGELRRQRVLLLVELGLFQQATQAGLRYLARFGSDAAGYVAIAEALRRGKQHERAILILEQARLRFPASDQILKQLARSYLDEGNPFIAAELLARAAHLRPELRIEAAELYRRAGHPMSALALNEQAIQQQPKVRQRLGLLLERERFEEAAAMAPRLSRLGLLADQEIVYGLAYALYQSQRFAEAERYLKRLTKPELFERAIQLRKAMDACRARGWECE